MAYPHWQRTRLPKRSTGCPNDQQAGLLPSWHPANSGTTNYDGYRMKDVSLKCPTYQYTHISQYTYEYKTNLFDHFQVTLRVIVWNYGRSLPQFFWIASTMYYIVLSTCFSIFDHINPFVCSLLVMGWHRKDTTRWHCSESIMDQDNHTLMLK